MQVPERAIDTLIFSRLKVLSSLVERFGNLRSLCPDVGIVSVQHLLESTGSLFESLTLLGFRPENIFLTGKIYSTHRQTEDKLRESLNLNVIQSSIPSRPGFYRHALESDVKAMWERASEQSTALRRIIVLDDGGYTLKNVPSQLFGKTIGIEQTTSGICLKHTFGKFPVINVARSAAKTIIEPRIVSESVKLRLGETIRRLGITRIGIVGYGSVGEALAEDMAKNFRLLVYDRNVRRLSKVTEPIKAMKSLKLLYDESELVIGATGSDISEDWWISECKGDKVLLSVSSGDIEFNRLLRSSERFLAEEISSPLQTIVLKTPKGHFIKILRGGMVANFTGEANSSPPEVIQITRGLLFAAILQILMSEKALQRHTGPIMLDPHLQKFVIARWFEALPDRKLEYPEKVVNGFKNESWIARHSKGIPISSGLH